MTSQDRPVLALEDMLSVKPLEDVRYPSSIDDKGVANCPGRSAAVLHLGRKAYQPQDADQATSESHTCSTSSQTLLRLYPRNPTIRHRVS